MTEPRVVAAFPATGKSHAARENPRLIDRDSTEFSWVSAGIRNRSWPSNYMAAIEAWLAMHDVDAVLVSTHAEVRAALADRGIPFTLVYPDRALREEYRERMERRGSPPALIAKVIDELWDTALNECEAQEGCDQIVLGPGQYLTDVIGAAHV